MTDATFTAPRLEDALALVKRALGNEALIVSSRKLDASEGPGFEVRASVGGKPAAKPEPTASVLERVLAQNEIPAALARDLMLRGGASARSLREAQECLDMALRALVAFRARTPERVVALVGPTGVGKTTTIAKLAARDALIERCRVALISTDDYRVGGVEQLERFADLIGVPMEVATDRASLRAAVARHADADRIYIDTAGRAPRDKAALASMAAMLRECGEAVGVELCLTASTRGGELTQALERHAVLSPSAIVATKLDEAHALGGVVAAAVRSGLPLSVFATGQRVPEDVEIASAARLAAAMCGDEVSA